MTGTAQATAAAGPDTFIASGHRLRERFTLYGATLATLLVLAMTLLSYAQTKALVLAAARHEVDETAHRLLEPIVTTLSDLRDDLRRQAQDVLAGRDELRGEPDPRRLNRLLQAPTIPPDMPYRLTLTDRGGHPRVARGELASTVAPTWVADAIRADTARSVLTRTSGRSRWQLVVPIPGQNGLPPAGALVFESDLTGWLEGNSTRLADSPYVQLAEFRMAGQPVAVLSATVDATDEAPETAHVEIETPLTDAGERASITVTVSMGEFQSPLRDLLARHLLIGLLGVALVAAVAGLIARLLTRRIEALAAHAGAIVTGKAAAETLPLAAFGRDEVGDLAQAVVTLLGRLKAHEQDLERLVAERTAALQQTESELLRAQQVAQTGSWRLDCADGELVWSAVTCRIFGIEQAPRHYLAFLDLVHPDDREMVDRAWQRAMNGMPYDVEHRILVDGAVRWVRERAEFTTLTPGDVLVALGTVQDITDRKLLVEQMQRLSVAVEQSPTSIVITDLDGLIEYVNPCFERTSGYRREELIGKKPGLIKSGRTLPFEYGTLWATIRTGHVWRGEFENVRKDGTHFFEMASISPILDPTGRITGYVGIKEDVTERKAFERLVRAREAQLRALIDSLPDILVVTSRQGQVLEAHIPGASQYGLRPTDLSANGIQSFLPNSAIRRMIREFARLTPQAPRKTIDLSIPIEGNPRQFSVAIALMTDAESATAGYIMLARDVTEQRAIEQSLVDSEAYNKALFDSSQIALVIMQPETAEFIDCNDAAAAIYGCAARADLLGRTLNDFSPRTQYDGEPSAELAPQRIADALRAGSINFEWRHTRADGSAWDAEIKLMAFRHDGQTLLQCSLQDITDRRRIEAQMRQALMVFKASSQGIMTTDRNSLITSVNPAFCRITGYTRDEVIGRPASMFRSDQHDAAFFRAMWKDLLSKGNWEGEIWNCRKSGEIYPQWLTISALRNSQGDIAEFVSLFSDITLKKQQEAAIWRQANFDSLTGLANRNLLHDRLGHALTQARRHHTKVGLLFLDLDGFKWINDTLGHDVGDQLLIDVAERLRQCVREQDTVARLGGDEFTVVVADLNDAEGMRSVAEKAVNVLRDPFTLAGSTHHLSGSVGVTVFPDDGSDVQTLMKNADIAMYKSKQAGKNRFHFYAAQMQADAHSRMQMEADLRQALWADAFVLHFQPVVDADSGELIGAEALLRWPHPTLGLIQPDDFVPIAEESGLIVAIGAWALRAAARQWCTWQALRPAGATPLRLALNVSAIQFREAGLAGLLQATTREYGIPTECLLLEITESVLIDGNDTSASHLHEIHANGFTFALDDFGTGFSSLSYLKRFPVDIVKIDRSFVRDCPDDRNDARLVEAIVNMAHSLDLKVAAEGVETEAQLRFLRELGCDAVQGFLISPPVPAETFALMIRQHVLLATHGTGSREEIRLLSALRTDNVDVEEWLERLLGEHSPDLSSYLRERNWVTRGLDLRQALHSHLAWRRRLNQYVLARGEHGPVDEADAGATDRCTLGQWIQRLDVDNPRVKHLDAMHREFHALAARIVSDYHLGYRSNARRALTGLRFRTASRDVVTALIAVFADDAHGVDLQVSST